MSFSAAEFATGAATVLRREVVHAWKSIPRRGAEAGGLLCGVLTPVPRIESVIPVAIEHRFGPTFRLSDADREKLATAVASGKNVVGWYRSNTRPAFEITPEDRELWARLFPSAGSAFLLCSTDSDYNVTGRFHVWQAGKDETDSEADLGRYSLLEEALQAAAEEYGTEPEETPAPAMNVQPQAPPQPQFVQPEPAPVRIPQFHGAAQRAPMNPMLRGALMGLGAFALVAGLFYYLRDAPQSAPAAATVHANNIGLGLKVDRQGKALLINWDRQSAAVLEATDATFTINEGTHNKVLRLSRNELHTGGVLYTPQSADDVQVELALHGPGGNFAQSLRIVQDTPAPVTAPRPKPVRPAEQTPASSPADDEPQSGNPH